MSIDHTEEYNQHSKLNSDYKKLDLFNKLGSSSTILGFASLLFFKRAATPLLISGFAMNCISLFYAFHVEKTFTKLKNMKTESN